MSDHHLTHRCVNDDTCVIVAESTLDNNNAHEMHGAIGELLSKGYKHIVVDMSQLEFLASAGVGSIILGGDLLAPLQTAREAGGDIILCNVSKPVQRVLDVLDLGDYLTVSGTIDDATARISAASSSGESQ